MVPVVNHGAQGHEIFQAWPLSVAQHECGCQRKSPAS